MVSNEINDPVKQLEDCIEFLRTPRKKKESKKVIEAKDNKKKSKTNTKKIYKSFMKVASILVIACLFVTFACVVKLPNVEQFIITIVETFSINFGVDSCAPNNITKIK